MISLTRLSGSVFALNSDLIERIDSTPDTVVTLVDGSKYVVAESLRSVVAAIRLYRAEVAALSSYVRVDDAMLCLDEPALDHHAGAPSARRTGHGAHAAGSPALAVVTPHPAAADAAGTAERRH